MTNFFAKLKTSFDERKASLRDLYHYNDELFHLAVKRYGLAVRERKQKTLLKVLNLMVNSYGMKMFHRVHGYPHHQSNLVNAGDLSDYRTQFDELHKSADLVTFDIFDTLLVRKVSGPPMSFASSKD